MSRRVLVIAYFFPPMGGAGVQRALKFVEYLPEYGYQPIVLSTHSRDYPARDPSLLWEIPRGTVIVRARDPTLLRRARVGFDYLGLRRLRALAGWPDVATAWLPAAVASALRLVRRHAPDVVLSTAPPFSSHLVAWMTARLSGLPWVADFRDEFAANPRTEWRTSLAQRLDRAVEQAVISGAQRVVTVADYFEVAGAPASRRITIPNGVDLTDLDHGIAAEESGRFKLSFVGTLYGDLDIAPVTSALRNLVAKSAIDPSRCELRIVGNMWLAQEPDSGAVPVRATGYVSHREAVAEMRAATVLLLYVPSSSPAPSGKLFEYLACERPMLCVTRRDSMAYDLVQRWDAGIAVEPDDVSGIESAISELYRRWEAGILSAAQGVRQRVLERYSRRTLTGELVAVLDAAIEAAPSAAPPASRR